MAIAVNKVTNANVYVDGRNYLGRAEEVNLPDVQAVMAEHGALGMIGKFELFSGFEKMEASIKWNSIYRDAMTKFANPVKAVQIQVRASIEQYGPSGRTTQVPLVVFMTVTPKTVPLGNFKQQENVELTSELNVLYVRQEIDGQSVLEFDPLSNIYKVNGEDLLEVYRANIGG
jgi:P2 family phage contractile tail tube protein